MIWKEMTLENETKFCTGCQQVKSLRYDFGKSPRNRCKKCLNRYQKEYAIKLGSEYREQRRKLSEKRRNKNPVLFYVQERISGYRRQDPESDLSTDYLVELWEKQMGLCYYTGVPMVFAKVGIPLPNSTSLDKLDPSIGYKRGNVVWACYQVNTSKGHRSEREFYDFCKLVLERSEERYCELGNE
jgi:hypothetical protein